jgi:hypothetical protein
VTTTADTDTDVDAGCRIPVSQIFHHFPIVTPALPLLFAHVLPLSKSFAVLSSRFSAIPLPQTDKSHTELVEAEDENRLVDLESEDRRLNQGERSAVDLDETLALLAVGNCSGSLLLAEALDALNSRHDVWWMCRSARVTIAVSRIRCCGR